MSQSTSALVIIDVQNEFMSTKGNFSVPRECKRNLVKNLKGLVPRFRKSGGYVIWVKALYENRTEEPAGMQAQEKGSNKWLIEATHVYPVPCCEPGTFGSEIYPEVWDLSDAQDVIVTKGGYSVFWESTVFLELLRAKNVTDVYFTGLASKTCVLATVLDAVKIKDLKVYAVPDCMEWRRYNTHEEAIAIMKELPMDLIDSDQIITTMDLPKLPALMLFVPVLLLFLMLIFVVDFMERICECC